MSNAGLPRTAADVLKDVVEVYFVDIDNLPDGVVEDRAVKNRDDLLDELMIEATHLLGLVGLMDPGEPYPLSMYSDWWGEE